MPFCNGIRACKSGGGSGELRIMTRLAGRPGKVHGEECAVGGDQGEPEVELAEALAHQAAGHEGEPVVHAGKDREASAG